MEDRLPIYINTLSIDESKAGIKIYLMNLIAALLNIKNDNQFILICSKTNIGLFKNLLKNTKQFSFITIPFYMQSAITRIFADQFLVPIFLRDQQGILLTPSDISIFCMAIPQVIVVQNALCLNNVRSLPTIPDNLLKLSRRLYFTIFLPFSLRKASAVVCPSYFFYQMLTEEHTKAKSKTYVIHEGVSEKMFRRDLDRSLAKKIQLPRRFIFFLSTLWRHKNADRLIIAFGILKKKRIFKGVKLIIGGKDPDGKQIPRLRQIAQNSGVGENTIFLGELAHASLYYYYKNSRVFVYPSSVESFGLPVLEAMVCQTPVVAANQTSIPEIVGDAALLVDPADPYDIAHKIEMIERDPNLRSRLIEKGCSRVKAFSWEKTGRAFLELFNEIAITHTK
jgi:glycosyltransferase involved in cell wall biosynthesis